MTKVSTLIRQMAKEGHKLASLEKASVLSASDDPKDQDKAREIRVRHDYESLKKQISSKKKPSKPAVEESMGGGVPLTPQELEIQKKMSKLNVRLARKRSQQMQKAKVDDTETSPEQVKEGDVHSGQGEKIQKRTKAWMDKKGQKGAPGLDAMKARTAEHKAKRGEKRHPRDQKELDRAKAFIKKNPKFGIKEEEDVPRNSMGKPIRIKDKIKAAKGQIAHEEVEIDEGKKKGLWDRIHAKRNRGEKPAKPGDKDYPKTLNVEGLEKARKNVGADKCWDGYKAKGTKKKGGKEVPNCVKEDGVNEGSAWTKKSGKNPEGGLNEKGRKSYERDNPGSDLKAPQPEGGSRKKSFCARMGGMKKKLTSAKTANDPDSRINKSLRKWKCNEEDKAFNFVRDKLKAKYGSGVLTTGEKPKPPTAKQKAEYAAHKKKIAQQDHRDPTEKASDGRYSDRHSNRGSD